MSTHSKKEIDDQFRKLPEIIRVALVSEETAIAVKKIGDKYQLHIDQIGYLAAEIGFVILGLEPSINFLENIKSRLGLAQPTAEQVTTDCNREIFVKIRESLKQLEENKNTPKPEDLLKEINRSPSIFEQKMSEPMSIRPVDNGLTINPDTPTTLPTQTKAVHFDPYHEPIN